MSKHYTMLTQFVSFSMWKTHLGHWYIKLDLQNFTIHTLLDGVKFQGLGKPCN